MQSLRLKARHAALVTLSVVGGVTLGAALVTAATTISTNISTGGTLEVTGVTTLTGAATLSSTLEVNGDITLQNDETISNSTNGTITLGATTMKLVGTASTSAIKVGDEADASTINGLIFGYCTADITVTASSTAYVDCTATPASAVQSGDRVFVQATSSMPTQLVVIAASSTASAGTIQLRVLNTGITAGDVSSSVNSLNFWAVRP